MKDSAPSLIDRLADRFELLLKSRIVLQELEPYVTGKLGSSIGRRAEMRVLALIDQRRQMTIAALDALRQQYPDDAHLLERRTLDKLSLRREEMEYRALFGEGVIGLELYTACGGPRLLRSDGGNPYDRPRLALRVLMLAVIPWREDSTHG